MKFTLRSIFVFAATTIYTGAASQNTTLKKQNGYQASQTSGSISQLSRWNSFKFNEKETFTDPQQKMLSHLGITNRESKIPSNKYEFYGGEAYKGNNVPYASVTDSDGNTYITGGSSNESQSAGDFLTLKIGPDGQSIWEKREAAMEYAVEYGMNIALDNSGNIIVSGLKWNGNDMDIRIIKYDTAGSKLWETTFDNNATGVEIPNGMSTDSNGNIYITGMAWSGNSVDYLTIKYNSNGVEQWHRSENPAGGETWNEATAVTSDDNGNVLVTGYSPNTNGWLNYHTIKYNSDGTKIWEKAYNYESTDPENVAPQTNSVPRSVIADQDGNIYITGTFDTLLNRIGTIKYNAAGEEQWVQSYRSNDELTYGLKTGLDNNTLYVAGTHRGGFADDGTVLISYTLDGTQNWIRETSDLIEPNSATLSFDTTHNIIISSNGMTLGAEPWEQDGAARAYKYSAEGNDLGQAAFVISTTGGSANMGNMAGLGMDNNGNIYFTVNSYYTEKGAVFETVKSTFGTTPPQTLWNSIYSNKGNPDATMLNSFADKLGNTFSTGSYFNFADGMLNPNYFIVKHNTQGNLVWSSVYNSTNGNTADGIIGRADANGNSYVCLLPSFEQSPPTLKVIKISPEGTQLWEKELELANPTVYVMEPQDDGSVYLGGVANAPQNNLTSFVGIKLNSDGSEAWKTYTRGTSSTTYVVNAGKVAKNGQFILTGSNTVMFKADGSSAWIKPITVDGKSTVATDLYISPESTIYVNGYTQGGIYGQDIMTAKLNIEGEVVWSKAFGDANRGERSYTIKPFSNGAVGVIGYSLAQNGDIHNTLIKYSSDGELLWDFASENMRYYNDFYIDGSDVCYIMNQAIVDPFPHKIFNQPFPIASLVKVDGNGQNSSETSFPGPEYAEFFGVKLIPHQDDKLLLAGSAGNQSFYKGLYFFETEHDSTLNLSDDFNHSTTHDTLGQNYPNPASDSTTIPFNLMSSGKVVIKLYNTQGSLIREIANNVYPKGSNTVTFETDALTTGIYFYQLESSGYKQAKKMIIK